MIHTYSLASDFPNNKVDQYSLREAILADASILIALDRIDVFPNGDYDRVDIVFKAVLSAGDITALDAVVTAHTGEVVNAVDMVSINLAESDDGVLKTMPQPMHVGYHLCDRDILLNTSMMTDSFKDVKVNSATNAREDWGEMTLKGVYKDDNGTMVECVDQADADLNAILTVWDFLANDQTVDKNPIDIDIRGGELYPDSAVASAASRFEDQIYVVVAPDVPAVMGGSIRFFDGYINTLNGGHLSSISPAATNIDPSLMTAAGVARVYIYHGAGKKYNHVLRLIMYRPFGAF